MWGSGASVQLQHGFEGDAFGAQGFTDGARNLGCAGSIAVNAHGIDFEGQEFAIDGADGLFADELHRDLNGSQRRRE